MLKNLISAGVVVLFLSATTVLAADIPQDIIDTQKFNSLQCIDENTQVCINNQCLTSEARDCQEQCATLAKAKCAQESN